MTRAKTDVECILKSALVTGEAAVKESLKGFVFLSGVSGGNLNLKSGEQVDLRTTLDSSLDTRNEICYLIDPRAPRTGHAPQSKNPHDVDKIDTGFVVADKEPKSYIKPISGIGIYDAEKYRRSIRRVVDGH